MMIFLRVVSGLPSVRVDPSWDRIATIIYFPNELDILESFHHLESTHSEEGGVSSLTSTIFYFLLRKAGECEQHYWFVYWLRIVMGSITKAMRSRRIRRLCGPGGRTHLLLALVV